MASSTRDKVRNAVTHTIDVLVQEHGAKIGFEALRLIDRITDEFAPVASPPSQEERDMYKDKAKALLKDISTQDPFTVDHVMVAVGAPKVPAIRNDLKGVLNADKGFNHTPAVPSIKETWRLAITHNGGNKKTVQ